MVHIAEEFTQEYTQTTLTSRVFIYQETSKGCIFISKDDPSLRIKPIIKDPEFIFALNKGLDDGTELMADLMICWVGLYVDMELRSQAIDSCVLTRVSIN